MAPVGGGRLPTGVTAACCRTKPLAPGTSRHHDDPYLTCLRRLESSNRYYIDSADGRYHGAYRFLQNPWDGTARHVGRTNLVGVDPHAASPVTQDDMAWPCTSGRGKQPWAGSGC
jgi:hypothetical protein